MNAAGRGNRTLRLLPGLVLSAAAIVALIIKVNWRQTFQALGQADLWVTAPAAVLIVCAMSTRAVAWRYLLHNSVPLRKAFWVLNISYMLSGFLPFRLGDIARAYLISRPDGGDAGRVEQEKNSADCASPLVSGGTALSAVVIERVFDVVFAALLGLLILPSLSGKVPSGAWLVSSVGLAALGFLALLLLGAWSARIMHSAEWIAGKMPILRPVLKPLEHFLEGLRQVRDLRYSLPAFLWLSVTLLLWAAEYWVVLRGFFPGASVYWGLLSLMGGLIAVALPASPSSLGVFELSVTVLLTAGGLARDTAVAYAISLHMLNILGLSLLGLMGLAAERQSLGSILSAAQKAEKS
jgi:glycosyltransferase 2 family protein